MERQSNIELARILAFVMVVMIHVGGPYISANHYVGSVNWLAANALDGFGRISLGVFVLITGYGLCVSQSTVRKRLKALLIPLPFFLAPTLLLYLRDGFAPGRALFLFFRDLPVYGRWFFHLWYVGTAIALYAISPWLNKLIAALDKAAFRRLLAACVVLFSGVPTINYVLGYGLIDTSLFASRLGVFAMLYLTGAYMRLHADLARRASRRKLALFLGLNAFVVLLGVWYNSRLSPLYFFVFLKDHGLAYPFGEFIGGVYDMNCLAVVAASAAFFAWILSLDFTSRLVNLAAKQTYGAYLIHVFWLYQLQHMLGRYLYEDSPNFLLKCAAFLAAVCGLSLASAWVMNTLGREAVTLCKRLWKRQSAQ